MIHILDAIPDLLRYTRDCGDTCVHPEIFTSGLKKLPSRE